MEQIAINLGIIIILGILCTKLLSKYEIPGFIGLIGLGILLGPFGFNLLYGSFLDLSRELSIIAIVILLIRAGLGISKESIRKVGRPAITMGFLPSIFEGMSIAIIAPFILGISFIESGILGFVLGAVSPAIIIPSMFSLIDKKLGTNKSIPTMILAGASADDVVAITLFSSFLGAYFGSNINIAWTIIGIPVSLILGLLLGFVMGLILLNLFRKWNFTLTEKLLMILATGLLLNGLSQFLEGTIPIAGLLGVMVVGFMIYNKTPKTAIKLSNKFRKVWILAEILVFIMLGAHLNLYLVIGLIIPGLAIICIGLLFRSIGVYLSLFNTDLNIKEKIFSMVAYFPKATVQATLGAIPLASGVASGEIIVAIATLAIIFAAPLGAIGIKTLSGKLLTEET